MLSMNIANSWVTLFLDFEDPPILITIVATPFVNQFKNGK